jgi:hypothetical protein
MGFFPDIEEGAPNGIKQYWQKWLQTARWPKPQETVVDDYDKMMEYVIFATRRPAERALHAGRAFKNGTDENFPIVFPDGKDEYGKPKVKVHYVEDGLDCIKTLRHLVADLFTYPLTDKEDKMKRNGALYGFSTIVFWRVAERGQGGTTSRVRLLSPSRLMRWDAA